MLSQLWPTYHDVMIAHKNCRLHKPPSRSQIQFEMKLGESISTLHKEIHSDRYCPTRVKCFIVTHPKPREIFAADFRDRIVHHLIVSELEAVWDKKMIYSSFACRLRKGTHGAIKYTQSKVRELSQGGVKPVWALQLDIEKFFPTIHRPILCELLLKHVYHARLRQLIQIVYSHDARVGALKCGDPSLFSLIPQGRSWFDQLPHQGIAIGNLTSQFAANAYLTGLDHFIQRELKPSTYLRYMDDQLLLDQDPKKLEVLIQPINQWLITHRSQQLNSDKTHLTNLRDGIKYLGYELKQVDSASQPLHIFPEPIKKWKWIIGLNQIEKLQFLKPERPHTLCLSLPNKILKLELASVNSKLGTFTHCNSYLFRKKSMENFINNTTIHFKIPTKFVDPWCPFKIKKGYRAIQVR
jgi:RNA-directed DNA polymerase